MTGFTMSKSEADCAAVGTALEMTVPDVKSFVSCFETVEELEALEASVLENSRAVLTDQSLRKYCELIPVMNALKEQQKTEVKHSFGFWGCQNIIKPQGNPRFDSVTTLF